MARLSDTRIIAFRLSTGERLWEQTPQSPCRNLIVTGSRIFSGCGDKVVARAIDSGRVTVIDPGPQALNPVLSAGSLVSLHQDGRLNVYDVDSGKRRASRVISELGRAFRQHLLVDPSSNGICALGLLSIAPRRFEYRAGCYDDRLVSRWSKTVVMQLPRDPVYDVRQLGPRFAVLDDQSSAIDSGQPLGRGRGEILRWQDGEVTTFADGTFATVENASGERIPAKDHDVFHNARTLVANHEIAGPRDAQVVSDDLRAFVLIHNGGLALGGVDRPTGSTLFLVPVGPSRVSKLEMANGLPVIRSQLDDGWAVTVYEPSSGRVLFKDARPSAR